jgi:hypothetical protein
MENHHTLAQPIHLMDHHTVVEVQVTMDKDLHYLLMLMNKANMIQSPIAIIMFWTLLSRITMLHQKHMEVPIMTEMQLAIRIATTRTTIITWQLWSYLKIAIWKISTILIMSIQREMRVIEVITIEVIVIMVQIILIKNIKIVATEKIVNMALITQIINTQVLATEKIVIMALITQIINTQVLATEKIVIMALITQIIDTQVPAIQVMVTMVLIIRIIDTQVLAT